MVSSEIIPFHKTALLGGEKERVQEAIASGRWDKECDESLDFFKKYYPDSYTFFTNSCSSALELAIRSLGIGHQDEVIIPGYGYVAVANAVVNNGAIPVFADVVSVDGNIDVDSVAACITPKTKAVIAIHYAGNAFDIVRLKALCDANQIFLVEDAAQSIGSTHSQRYLGSFGHIACLSFDYMKNITCGQGGLLIVNDPNLLDKVWVTYDDGTDRHAFFQGLKDYYQWVAKGNNSRINPLSTYFLAAQLEVYQEVTELRKKTWLLYHKSLSSLSDSNKLTLPDINKIGNGHIFYILAKSAEERADLRKHLRQQGIYAEPHYTSLAKSELGKQYANPNSLLHNSEAFASRLLRLPLWNGMNEDIIARVVEGIGHFYHSVNDKYTSTLL